jgi:hypothetical protein
MRGMPWLDRADAGSRAALADLSARRWVDGGGAGVAGVEEWTEIGLSAVLRRAAPSEDDQRPAWCTCGG